MPLYVRGNMRNQRGKMLSMIGVFSSMLDELFIEEAKRHRIKGCYGVTSYRNVYSHLMPVQQEKLKLLSGNQFKQLFNEGSFITIAFAYPNKAIRSIAVEKVNGYNLEKWNYYSEWYSRLNQALDESSLKVARRMNGINIPATLGGMADDVPHVEDYYPLAVSHRVGAELSGVGWRGKNELIVNPRFSCAIRLASVIVPVPLRYTATLNTGCGECNACLQVCPFLRNKDKLENYREQCLRYIVALGLDEEVCGKCIKACVYQSSYADQFHLD